jgi:hypothetical protein
MPEGVVTRTWAHPRSPAGFACEWRTEVRRARELGRRLGPSRYHEVRYEELVADTEGVVRSICDFAGLPFEAQMLEFAGAVDVSAKPHHQRLLQPPTRGVRDWSTQMSAKDVAAFEAVAGDLLEELGYEVRGLSRARPGPRASVSLAWYRARMEAWNTVAYATQRSPLWRRRHPRLI